MEDNKYKYYGYITEEEAIIETLMYNLDTAEEAIQHMDKQLTFIEKQRDITLNTVSLISMIIKNRKCTNEHKVLEICNLIRGNFMNEEKTFGLPKGYFNEDDENKQI